ncbi:hypothetical protein CPB83DRAFT_861454 [Crepidotus variabilis]|uniref:Secreted protein n=1 Tax=Crepidotus variabilis TaxID=179855 RepID=A0A9P6E8D9_9AGAR|nr:hypothetical protein CPB83DRAFT_861454 [Crepidotus variabilis]
MYIGLLRVISSWTSSHGKGEVLSFFLWVLVLVSSRRSVKATTKCSILTSGATGTISLPRTGIRPMKDVRLMTQIINPALWPHYRYRGIGQVGPQELF